uniref:Uncharacterized protein n=1 Tax=Setaria digitata TaxID=48799 RepID=A0A915PTT1_9BILA
MSSRKWPGAPGVTVFKLSLLLCCIIVELWVWLVSKLVGLGLIALHWIGLGWIGWLVADWLAR